MTQHLETGGGTRHAILCILYQVRSPDQYVGVNDGRGACLDRPAVENGPNILPRQRGETRQGRREKPSAEVRLHSRGPSWHSPLIFRSKRERWKMKGCKLLCDDAGLALRTPCLSPPGPLPGIILETTPRRKTRQGRAEPTQVGNVQRIRFWLGRAAPRQL